ncbi:MAG TPA: DUF2203 domain-containing protein [Actinomycetota bacterium]|jgi:hypothetical protein
MTAEREFTEEEANHLLPALSESLRQIQQAREIILAGAEHIRRSASLDGGGQVSQEYWNTLQQMRRHLEALAEQDIILRDADSGLVDFPSRREGRDVFLCWRLGEERVEYWHPPETGFSGRRRL